MNNLDDILDLQPTEPTEAVIIEVAPEEKSLALVNPEKAIDSDLNYARNKLKQIIDSSQITLESVIALAEETAQPRAYEVVGTLIQAIVTANKELLQLHKTRADAVRVGAETTPTGPKQDITIEKAVFVGRAQDLLRELNAAKIRVDLEDGQG